jgi:hypothetical protein
MAEARGCEVQWEAARRDVQTNPQSPFFRYRLRPTFPSPQNCGEARLGGRQERDARALRCDYSAVPLAPRATDPETASPRPQPSGNGTSSPLEESDFLKVGLSTDPVSSRERFATCRQPHGNREGPTFLSVSIGRRESRPLLRRICNSRQLGHSGHLLWHWH